MRTAPDDRPAPFAARRPFDRLTSDAFFALWKSADSDLLPLIEARREYARLIRHG
jgi:hypothetical protein